MKGDDEGVQKLRELILHVKLKKNVTSNKIHFGMKY